MKSYAYIDKPYYPLVLGEAEHNLFIEKRYKPLSWPFFFKCLFSDEAGYWPMWTKDDEIYSTSMVQFLEDREPRFKHHIDISPQTLKVWGQKRKAALRAAKDQGYSV